MNNSTGRHLLKLISFGFAITFWFYVLNSEPIEVKRQVPLVLISPKGKAINVQVPKTLEVTFKGSRSFLEDLDIESHKVFIDLKKEPYRGKDRFNVQIKKSNIPAPFGLSVLDFKPNTFVVGLEKKIKKLVRVKANLVGELSSELRLVSSKIKPTEMMIEGPRSEIKKVGILTTRPIDLAVLEGEGKMVLGLEPVDERIFIEGGGEVEFDYSVRPTKANLTLKNIPIRFLSSKSIIRSKIKAVALDVLVPKDKEKLLTNSGVKVIAELPLKARGRVKVKLRAELPEGIHLLRIHPESINVSVK